MAKQTRTFTATVIRWINMYECNEISTEYKDYVAATEKLVAAIHANYGADAPIAWQRKSFGATQLPTPPVPIAPRVTATPQHTGETYGGFTAAQLQEFEAFVAFKKQQQQTSKRKSR